MPIRETADTVTAGRRPVVLFVDQFSALAGGQRALLDVASGIRDLFTPVVAVPGSGLMTEELERRGIRWERISSRNYPRGVRRLYDMGSYVAEQPRLSGQIILLARSVGADLIHANGPRMFLPTAIAARWLHLPLIWSLYLEVESTLERWVMETAARFAHPVVLACSRACLAPFSPNSPLRQKMEVIYTGIPPVEIPAALRERDPARCPVIGMVTVIHPDKGQDQLLRAAPIVLRAFPHACFRLIGSKGDEAYVRELHRLAETLGEGRVEFCGPINSPAQAFAGLDVVVVASRREALSRVVREAFSAGVPVVASTAGGTSELIQSGRNGLLFSAGNTEELASSLIHLLRDASVRETIIRGGRESFELHWRVERFQEEMRARFAAVLAQQC